MNLPLPLYPQPPCFVSHSTETRPCRICPGRSEYFSQDGEGRKVISVTKFVCQTPRPVTTSFNPILVSSGVIDYSYFTLENEGTGTTRRDSGRKEPLVPPLQLVEGQHSRPYRPLRRVRVSVVYQDPRLVSRSGSEPVTTRDCA